MTWTQLRTAVRRAPATVLSVMMLAALVAAGNVARPAVAEAASGCTQYTYRQGGYSTCIKYIQQIVNASGWASLSVDGDFGPKTRAGVIAFQRSRGITADGIVGPQTWNRLCAVPGATSARKAAGCSSTKPDFAARCTITSVWAYPGWVQVKASVTNTGRYSIYQNNPRFDLYAAWRTWDGGHSSNAYGWGSIAPGATKTLTFKINSSGLRQQRTLTASVWMYGGWTPLNNEGPSDEQTLGHCSRTVWYR